jgi:uncharacterized protein (DUF983 family)
MLLRGLARRCPQCGERKVFSGRFKLKDRCPRCGLLFHREEGFWLGAYVINFGVGEGMVGILLMVFLFVKLNRPDMGLAPWLIAGAALGILLPILFFKNSRTIWAAIDVAMEARQSQDLT